ncbi:Conidial pigment polyketide synthase alb1 [Ceratocystis fimbriata CBS 114723]|uniref:Conidial pigment polyketide synthase alb1 n=1 Tax=Ceratocystis fimbriata CBS 114723 TaxID=1035309 RepID=A0A2C5WX43_9PEZI|nr:Conidial pigment polyketide synthase alb1 [Ceratocystis fimbriata CBS 114723]
MITPSKMAFNLFGDQSLEAYSSLSDFCRLGNPSIVAKVFMERAGAVLRDEIEALPLIERAHIPSFRSLYQLNEEYHYQSRRHSGIDSALLCITQIAMYIDRTEKVPEDYTIDSSTFNVGFCTGMFAAAAVSLSQNVSQLVPIGTQAALLAFRLGTYIGGFAEKLSPVAEGEKSASWTHIVSNMTEDVARKLLDEFHSRHAIPNASQAYISAVSATNVAISGQPSTLAKITSTGVFESKLTPIPVFGPYHSAQIHSHADLDAILKLNSPEMETLLGQFEPRQAIMCPSTGEWINETTAQGLFRSIAKECLCEPLLFTKAVEGCATTACAFDTSKNECIIVPYGPTAVSTSLATAISSQTDLKVTLRSLETPHDNWSGKIGAHGPQLGRCKLAIVGMSGRFPDADSHEKLWDLLCKGLDVHREVPADRFPVSTHYDPTGKAINTSHTPYGCWIERPGMFDPRFFNMSPREAYQTDPMQRMALTTAYEALEMSGYGPNRTASTRLDRIGTFYGQTSDDWRELNAAQEVDTYYITGGVRAFGPGRINYHFGFSGPSLNIDTACSSSAAAMQVACTSLWAKECDTAVVGGLSCMTNPDIFSGLSRGQFLSKTGSCKTFDDTADGYCRADGCASVVVKRLEDAEAENDRILAVILGTSTNHSAEAVSITHPHGPTQSVLSRAILDEAGVDPLDVDYVEMHGTGTQAGDGTEMVSVTDVFAPADRRRPADRPLYLGAVKSNIGHGEAASGVTALCKVLMMMQKNAIPPHVGIKGKINHTFPADLSQRNVNIPFHMTPFKRNDGKLRRVFINNFSAAGGNTGLLLEDAPRRSAPAEDPRSTHVITITAKSKASMLRNAERLVEFIKVNPDTAVNNIAYSTTARRIQHYWRMSIAATDLADAQRQLETRLKGEFAPVSAQKPSMGFLFTGQGSHYAGLGKALYANHSVFRDAINEFDRVCKIHGFPSFLPLIDGSESDVTLLSPIVVQTGLCAFEMALTHLWASWDIRPTVVLGHSLGEYAALYAAGVLSASDTLFLVGTRACMLVSKCTAGTHAMVAIQGSVIVVKDALGAKADSVNIACINGPRETVISGTAEEMASIAKDLVDAGFKCTQLKVPFAFHSAQVEPILDDFEKAAAAVQFMPAKTPIISPLFGKVLVNQSVNPNYLRRHAREAVDFLGGLTDAQQSNVVDDKTLWLEVGPHPICANMVKAAFGATTVSVPTLRRNEDTYKVLSNTLCALHAAGAQINWTEFHRDFLPCVRMLDLPAYAFDEKNYWLQYTGDWALTKNRGANTAPAKELAPPKPKLSTTSVHAVVKEEVQGDTIVIETETDLGREDTRRVLAGHMCNGSPLLPSTLYADIVMTVCDYAYRLVKPDAPKDIGINVCKVEVPKTVILDEQNPQTLRCSVVGNMKEGTASISFTTGEGNKKTEHAYCKVLYGDAEEWLDEFDKVNYLIKSRIDHLKRAESQGKASKISRGLAYKLFNSLVDYSPPYQGMEEVILDSDTCEATAKIVLKSKPEDGNFFFSPYWIDSCCHISGFILNGSDAIDSREQVYISHGWGSLRLPKKLDPSKEYRSYIRMQPIKGTKMMSGDCYIFDGDTIIGSCRDIRFQCIPRKVMNIMLPPRNGAGVAAASARAAAPVPARAAATAAASGKEKKQLTSKNIATVNAKLQKQSVISQVMDILAREIGVSHDELADEINFVDLGVDSLMGLTVAGCIREDLSIDLDNHVFNSCETIGAFKNYLKQFESGSHDASSQDESSDCSDEDEHTEPESNVTTPIESCDDDEDVACDAKIQNIFRQTIAKEMGVNVEELIAAPDLASMGMDSLMTLQILGELRELTGNDYPSSVFHDHATLEAVEKALGIGQQQRPKKIESRSHKPSAAATSSSSMIPQFPASSAAGPATVPKIRPVHPINTHPGNTTASIYKPPRPTEWVDHYPHRKATSVMLQGSSRTATRTLFMAPDGSGSATSYMEISALGSEWKVFGLFSPFMTHPEEFTCGVYGVATKFIEEIKRRQPLGPYSVAGWSAGGVIAFEMVHQLINAGDVVEHLVLIDAPCPVIIEPLPRTLHAWFADIGILGETDEKTKARKIPEWLLPHFASSVAALSSYMPAPFPDHSCPKTSIIWCEDGVCKYPTDPRPDPYPTGHGLFLLENRTDFGPNRWDEFIDWEKIETRQMPGNHFSMMKGDGAKQLGGLMREAVSR